MNALAASAEADVLDIDELEREAEYAEGVCGRIYDMANRALLEIGTGDVVDGDMARGLLMTLRGLARQGSRR